MTDVSPQPVVVPPAGSIERWAHDYVTSTRLADKLSPPAPGSEWAEPESAFVLDVPGRPAELSIVARAGKTPGPDAIRDPSRRAQLLHTFLHHELQAAELMCRALLAFPETPRAFRRGLLNICLDEIRHMAMYGEHIASLGHAFGDFPVNDWFWQRVPSARTPASFVAVMGLGFEGANLDHTQRFAERFVRVGDRKGAHIQELVGEEEIPHVAFGAHWFRQFEKALSFEAWRRALPEPLSPILMRGRPLHRAARERAGFPTDFMSELERWQPVAPSV